MHYNTALVGVETNFSTYPVMELERLRYPKQYVRESIDTYTHAVRQSFGFRTDSKTRPVAISELIKATREDITVVSDKATLEEMLTFVRDEKFKPTAEDGAHDDCVMALAIAHYIRPQQSYLSTKDLKTSKWSKEQWEDYRNADASGKEYLRKIWGNPR
jgi:phage terminase large subunit